MLYCSTSYETDQMNFHRFQRKGLKYDSLWRKWDSRRYNALWEKRQVLNFEKDLKLLVCNIQQIWPNCCLPVSQEDVAGLEKHQALSFLVIVHVICTEYKTQEILGSSYWHKWMDANQAQIYNATNEASLGSRIHPLSRLCELLGVLRCLGRQIADRKHFSCKESCNFLQNSQGKEFTF